MTQAQMTVAVVNPRCATGGALSPLTVGAPARDELPRRAWVSAC